MQFSWACRTSWSGRAGRLTTTANRPLAASPRAPPPWRSLTREEYPPSTTRCRRHSSPPATPTTSPFIGATDPNRYYMWSGHIGQRRHGRRPGPRQITTKSANDWTTYPERLERPGSPGRSTRTSWRRGGLDAAGHWGCIDDASPRQPRRQLPGVLQQVPERRARRPPYDKARTGTDAKNGDGYFDRP
ncbi:hypothetical protein LV779_28120 [Streptomyces thinghirensis]|nr:hypothetical protein [Streptomyces thinghirensis]